MGWQPFRVTVLTWVVLTLTVWNALRLWTALAWKEQLSEFAARPGPVYVGLTGALWVAVGLRVLWSLWQPKPWTAKLVLAAAATYTAWYWADRLVLQQERLNWAFTAALNVLLLAYVFFSTKSRHFQREAHERKPEK